MKKLFYFLSQMNNKKGQGMVEYGLIIGLIAVVVIAALVLMGDNIKVLFEGVAAKLSPPTGS